MSKVLFIADKISEDALDYLEGFSDLEVDNRPGLSPAEKLEAVARADALIVRSATQVDSELLEAAQNGDTAKLVAQIDRHDADTAYEVSGVHFVKGGQEDSCAMLTALAQSSGVEVGEHSVLHALLLGHGGQGEQVRSGLLDAGLVAHNHVGSATCFLVPLTLER